MQYVCIVFIFCGLLSNLSVKHNRLARSFTKMTVNLDTKLLFTASVRTVNDVSTCQQSNCEYISMQHYCIAHTECPNARSGVYIYEVVYMVTVLTLRPYAPLILLLRCQSNFLAIRMECAKLWNRCVHVLQAASCGALAGRVCGGYDSPNVCIDPSFLPPMLVNRWSDGRQATGLRKNERERSRERERAKRTAKQKEKQPKLYNELQT